jgi:hypothetical protein
MRQGRSQTSSRRTSVNDWGRVGEYIGKSIAASLRFDELLGLDRSDPYYWERIAAFCEIDLGLKPQEYWNDRDMSELMALAERRLARDRLAGAQPSLAAAKAVAPADIYGLLRPNARSFVDERHQHYVLLFGRVLEKRMVNGQCKTAVFGTWLRENRTLCRTQVTDYLAGRIQGKVGTEKRLAIEGAITASAKKDGLPDSD